MNKGMGPVSLTKYIIDNVICDADYRSAVGAFGACLSAHGLSGQPPVWQKGSFQVRITVKGELPASALSTLPKKYPVSFG
jgi:hypothetical protein